jgi:citrate synthase
MPSKRPSKNSQPEGKINMAKALIKKNPKTRIGSGHGRTDILTMRGTDTLNDIVGVRSFSETFYFIVTGRFPSTGELTCFDACMTVLMDHGLTPGALVARFVENSIPEDMQVPIAAGLLTVGNRHVGTISGAGKLLAEAIAEGEKPEAWAKRTAEQFREQKLHIPGFGHRHYNPTDPRAQRLFDVAEAAGCAGEGIKLIHVLSEAIDEVMGRHLTLNVTGAMGAVLTDIGWPMAAMRGVTVVSRAAGLTGHIYEEKQEGLTRPLMRYANETFSAGWDEQED